MIFYKRTTEKINSKRDVISFTLGGNIVYSVLFIDEYVNKIILFGHVIKEYKNIVQTQSHLDFGTQSLAEQYAQVATKPDYIPMHNWDDAIYIYPEGWDALEEYGRFGIRNGAIRGTVVDNYPDRGRFYFFDSDAYGTSYHTKYTNDVISNVSNLCQKIAEEKHLLNKQHVVSSFNVITHEAIPIDKLHATSDEIKQLNELLQEYYDKQEQYNKLLTKLLSHENI